MTEAKKGLKRLLIQKRQQIASFQSGKIQQRRKRIMNGMKVRMLERNTPSSRVRWDLVIQRLELMHPLLSESYSCALVYAQAFAIPYERTPLESLQGL